MRDVLAYFFHNTAEFMTQSYWTLCPSYLMWFLGNKNWSVGIFMEI